MTKDFSCRTCGNLCTQEWDNEGKAVIYYKCAIGNMDIGQPDEFFCCYHTDRETVKKIREGL